MKQSQTTVTSNMQFKSQQKRPLRKRIGDTLLQIDFFGQPAQLLAKQKEQHQTIFGGFFTIAIAAVTALFFYTQLAEMYNKSSPSTMTAEHHEEHPHEVIMTPDYFNFAFAMEDAYTLATYKNHSLFAVALNQCIKTTITDPKTGIKQPNFQCLDVPLVDCNIDDHFQVKELKPYFSRFDLKTLYCVDIDHWKKNPPKIEGEFDSETWQWVRFTVSMCQNSTANENGCAPQDVIDEQLSAGYMAMYFTNRMVDLGKSDNPSNLAGKDVFSTFSNKLPKEVNIFLKHVYTYSDDGYITSDEKIYDTLSYSYHNELIDGRVKGDFLNVVFRLQNQITINQRSYVKLQDIFGDVGGLWEFLGVIGVILVVPVNKLDLQLKILNEIFSFEVDQLSEKQQKKRTKKLTINLESQNDPYTSPPPQNSQLIQQEQKRGLNQQQKHFSSSVQQSIRYDQKKVSKATNQVFNHLQQYISQKGLSRGQTSKQINDQKKIDTLFRTYFSLNLGKLKLQTCEFLAFFFGCSKKVKAKKNQINFALRRLNQEIDILFVIKKFSELEKLKLLLLTKEQLRLFDYLPKPCIPREDEKQNIQEKFSQLMEAEDYEKQMSYWTIIQGEKSIYQKASEAVKAYEELMGKKNKNSIDLKLLDSIDPKVKRLCQLGATMGLRGEMNQEEGSDEINSESINLEEQVMALNQFGQLQKQEKPI